MKFAGRWPRSAGFRPKDEPWVLTPAPHVRTTERPPSLNGGVDTTYAPKTEPERYSGTSCIGLAAMHKSNITPVFSAEQAVDIARMRRG